MARRVITTTRLIDDLDGSEAAETILFAIDGKLFEIDLNKEHASALRNALKPYVAKARIRSKRMSSGQDVPTLYSTLTPDAKKRYRAWANSPDARRISDRQVEEWIAAGKPSTPRSP